MRMQPVFKKKLHFTDSLTIIPMENSDHFSWGKQAATVEALPNLLLLLFSQKV